MDCRFDPSLGLDDLTQQHMGAHALLWFAGRGDGRRWFICGAGVTGEPLTAEIVVDHILVRRATEAELLGDAGQ
jgi:hypothetical protein